ncbi:MAG: DUF2905 domain-containing protein [Pseudomonadota bacterium]
MHELGGIGKLFIITGILIVILGLVLFFIPKIPWIGRLPGNIYIKRNSVSFYFPITTCIVISILFTLFFYLFRR